MKRILFVVLLGLIVSAGLYLYDWEHYRKPQPPIISKLPGDPVSRDFYSRSPDTACIIIVPTGRSIIILDALKITPTGDTKLDDPPAPVQIYNCSLEKAPQ